MTCTLIYELPNTRGVRDWFRACRWERYTVSQELLYIWGERNCYKAYISESNSTVLAVKHPVLRTSNIIMVIVPDHTT